MEDIAIYCECSGRILEAYSLFKGVHNFLVQVWKAVYMYMVTVQEDDLYDLIVCSHSMSSLGGQLKHLQQVLIPDVNFF